MITMYLYKNPHYTRWKLHLNLQLRLSKGLMSVFFKLEGMFQHIESEVEKGPNIECELYIPRYPIQKKDY